VHFDGSIYPLTSQKVGVLAYSSGLFVEMLPTVSDKIEHFLSAHLGLADSRKWQGRVDEKLKSSKKLIKKVSESNHR
jgi:hypothetical protein